MAGCTLGPCASLAHYRSDRPARFGLEQRDRDGDRLDMDMMDEDPLPAGSDRPAGEAQARFLAGLDEALRAIPDAPSVMARAAEMVARHLGVSRTAYADVDDDSDRFFIRSDYSAPGVPSSAGTYSLDLFGPRAAADMRQGRTLVIRDVVGELPPGEGREMFSAIGIGAIICCPLVKDGRLVAMMAVHHAHPRDWRADEIALVEGVVERCWTHVQRVGAESRQRESEARYRALFTALDAGFCIVEVQFEGERPVDYRFLEVNAAFERQTGLADAEGRLASELAPTLEPHWYETYGRVAMTGEPVRFENEAAGLGRWFDVHAFRIGQPEERHVAVLFNDITTRRRAEIELRALNDHLEERVASALAERKLFADVFESTDAPVQVLGRDYTILAINQANIAEYERLYGLHPRPGDRLPDLFAGHADWLDELKAVWDRALAGESFTVTAEFGDPARERRAYQLKFSPVRTPDGTLIGACHFATNVTERLAEQKRLVEAEEQLRQSHKMEAMGQLTGGVAHDFNNLLTPIVGSLDMLQRKGTGTERERRLIDAAMHSAERAKTLVQRLLAFARRQPLQMRSVDMAELVTNMADLIASTTGPQIKVAVDIAEETPPALADQNQVEMALLNLAVNARDAMPEGGTLRISVTANAVGRTSPAGLSPGRYVKLSVADTGIGMDEATLARAIEPFFSTKGIGKGTGLGLSMVHGLAAQLGGALTIQSRRQLGTNVELWLPVSEDRPDDPAAPDVTGAAHGVGVALLVDDEDYVRLSAASMLADLGYAVVEAGSAEQALELVHKGLTPDLLVTDHLMPGMTGTDLARDLLSERPSLRVLVISGYAENEGIAPDLPRLTKPFKSDELITALIKIGALS